MSVRRRHALLWSLPGSAGLTGALGACSEKLPEKMKIGVIAPFSGPFGLRGKDLLDGANLAADEINASRYKIAGQRVTVEIVGMDDKGDVEAAKQGARQLVNTPVHAVIGPLLTPMTAATIPIFAEKGLPQLFAATASHLHTLGKGNTFRLQASDDLQGRAMAVFTNDNLQAQRIVTVVESGEYGQGLNKAFTEALRSFNRRVTTSIDVDGKSDVTAAMATKIKDAQADVVVLLAREPQLRSLYKTLAEVRYTDVTVLGPNVIRSKNVAALPAPVRAVYVTATSFDADEFPAGRPFLEAFASKYKAMPVSAAHYAYDAVFVLTDAARRCGSLNAAKLVAKLKVIDPITRVNQQMRFNAKGELAHPAIAVYKADRGLWLAQMRSSEW